MRADGELNDPPQLPWKRIELLDLESNQEVLTSTSSAFIRFEHTGESMPAHVYGLLKVGGFVEKHAPPASPTSRAGPSNLPSMA